MEHKTCQGYIELDKRVVILETEQGIMKQDIMEIKQNQKEARALTMATLISSVLGLVAIVITLLIALGG